MSNALQSPAYQAVIERLCDPAICPHVGYSSPSALPDLTREELAAVLEAEPSLLADALDDQAVADVAGMLKSGALTHDLAMLAIGARVVLAFHQTARAYIFCDVLAECERQALEDDLERGDYRSERERAASGAGVPVAGAI